MNRTPASLGILLLSAMPFASSSGAPLATMPCKMVRNLCYLRGDLGGVRNLSLVLDSGSALSVLARARESELGMTPIQTGSAGGLGTNEDQTYEVYQGVAIRLGKIALPDETILTLPLAYIGERNGVPADGLLGSNIFNRYVVDYDFIKKTVAFTASDDQETQKNRETLSMDVSLGVPVIDAAIDLGEGRKLDGKFIVDGGQVGSGLMIYEDFRNAHPELMEGIKLVAVQTSAVGGTIDLYKGRVKGLEIGPYRLDQPVTAFTVRTGGVSTEKGLAGAIGADVLARFDVAFDYSRKQIRISPNANFSKPFPANRSGITLKTQPPEFHHFVIESVRTQSPAEEVGIRAGDVLLRVNGIPAREMELDRILKIFEEGRCRCSLVLQRNGKTFKKTLMLRSLI